MMMASHQDESILECVAGRPRLFFSTLAPIGQNTSRPEPQAELMELSGSLVQNGHIRVAVVSGRRLSILTRLGFQKESAVC